MASYGGELLLDSSSLWSGVSSLSSFSIPLPFIFQEAKESIDEKDPRPTSSNGACISFRCSISSFSIYYAPESDFRLKSYDHLNFSRAFVVQFRASLYIMRLNQTSVWQVMTILISWELSLFNSELLDILSAGIGSPFYKLWPFEFLENFHCSISSVSIYYAPESDLLVKSYDHMDFLRASVVQFRVSWYIMRLNLTSVWKVMIIWITPELPLFNFERLDILFVSIGPPS